jgi:hypothetical protein
LARRHNGLAEPGIEEVGGRDVDRDRDHLTGGAPSGTLFHGTFQDERRQRLHEPGFLSQRNEVEGRDQSKSGMRPTHKGLHRGQLAGDEINLWLVVHLEMTADNGVAQLIHKAEPVAIVVDIVPV